ncbi:LysE family translocator [Candidatus Bathyarchaeota archaeon]|nr:LysE family translocator [Candidatus Bathyarchaeota archaeon]
MQFGLGFIIGFSGAAIPGPLTTLIVTSGLSGENRFYGILSALGHCIVEASIIIITLLGLVTVLDAAPLSLFNIAGGCALVFFGVIALLNRNKNHVGKGKIGITKNAFLGGITLTIFNGTIPLWWGTVGVPQLGYAIRSSTITGALLWVAGHWSADLAWYGFLGYSSYRGSRRLGASMAKHITIACSLILILVGVFFIYLAIGG